MSKVNIGIKANENVANDVHVLLDAAKQLGIIKDKGEYFNITFPFFKDYLQRKKLTQTEIGHNLAEVERATALIIRQFINVIETHNNIMKFSESENNVMLKEKDDKIEALSSLLEKTELENIQLKQIKDENEGLKAKLKDMESKFNKLELKHEKELNKVRMSNYQSLVDSSLKEVN